MMQLYDQEEVIKIHIQSERRNSAIQATVEICQEIGMDFMKIVDKIAKKYGLSKERAAEEVKEYWKE